MSTGTTKVPRAVATDVVSLETVADHLRKVVRSLGTPCRRVVLTVDAANSQLSHIDLPQTSPSDLRKMIKLSPKTPQPFSSSARGLTRPCVPRLPPHPLYCRRAQPPLPRPPKKLTGGKP